MVKIHLLRASALALFNNSTDLLQAPRLGGGLAQTATFSDFAGACGDEVGDCITRNMEKLYGEQEEPELKLVGKRTSTRRAEVKSSPGPGVDPTLLRLTRAAERDHSSSERFVVFSIVGTLAVCSCLGVPMLQGRCMLGLCGITGSSSKGELDGGGESWHRRVFSLPERGPVPCSAAVWLAMRVWLLTASAAAIYMLVEVQALRRFYWVFFMSFIGCVLPSAGVPVAGGSLYFPLLNLAGLPPRTCVAFVVAAQTVSVGVLTPISWLIKEPSIFMPEVFAWTLPGCIVGLFLGLFAFPLDGEQLLWFFTVCMGLLFAYTAHGLFHDLANQDEKLSSHKLAVKVCLVTAGVVGGTVMGWLGIGCDKIVFFVLTVNGVSSIKSSVMGVCLAGLLSLPVSCVHLRNGDLPLQLWLIAQPGLLLGSLFGGYLNEQLGSRTILTVFLAIIGFDVVKSLLSLLGHHAVI